MSRSIKVSDEVYQELIAMLQARESFSQVIERMLKVYRTIKDVSEGLAPSHYLNRKSQEDKGG